MVLAVAPRCQVPALFRTTTFNGLTAAVRRSHRRIGYAENPPDPTPLSPPNSASFPISAKPCRNHRASRRPHFRGRGIGEDITAAVYLRVSRDSQTTENQRIVVTKLAERRGFEIIHQYEGQGVSGGKGRDKRPAFDQLLKDAMRRRFDILLVWSMDRLRRSVLHVAQATAELDAGGVALISHQQGIDGTCPLGRAMMRMATVFAELERSMIRSRVMAVLDRVREQGGRLGRPSVGRKVEDAIRLQLGTGHGILKVAKIVGCGSGTVQRVKREMAAAA